MLLMRRRRQLHSEQRAAGLTSKGRRRHLPLDIIKRNKAVEAARDFLSLS